jgi:hypothetical protein
VIAGCSRSNIRHIAKNEIASANGEIPRRIGSAQTATPSSFPSAVSVSPGAETSVTSNPAKRSALRRPLSTRQVWSLVTPITRQAFSLTPRNDLARIEASVCKSDSKESDVIAEPLLNTRRSREKGYNSQKVPT